MEFNYLVEKNRMLNNLGRTSGILCACAGTKCDVCPLSKWRNGRDLSCTTFEFEYPVEATEIVRKWAEEHPRKTRKDVLLEKFPNAMLMDNNGGYMICAEYLGLCSNCERNNCAKCWNTEVE